ncbi:MAG: DUF3352 domain-containing protein [Bacteroidota bacterium]
MKTFFRILILLLLLGAAAIAGYFFLDPGGETRDLFAFVPPDYSYLVESDRPVGDWQNLSETEVWQYLKGTDYFADITESADYLDSLLKANQTLVDFIKLGDMLISAHMISRQEYDFLILVDLKGKGRKLSKLKPVTVELFKSLGYQVKTDSYYNIDLYHLYDTEYDETLTMSTIDNVLMISYTADLVKKAINQSENESVLQGVDFGRVRERINRDELYTVYLNYQELDRLMGAYTAETPEMVADLKEILAVSAFDLSVKDDHAKLSGYTKQIDSVPSFLRVFQDVGRGKVNAPIVLPTNTAMFTSLGFDDFTDFYQKFDAYYAEESPEDHKDLQKNINRIEKALKIDFDRDFFSWMTDEIVTAVVPTNPQATRYSYYAMLHFDDYDLTKERLDYVTKRIGKTPVKFEELDYKGYPIKYLKLRGFFSLFFKKLFSKIEQPHFTYIDDYVVFSNDTTALQVMIDAYLEGNVLLQADRFQKFQKQFKSKSNIYTYFQNESLYHYLSSTLDHEARNDLGQNKSYLFSFPQMGLQLYPGSGMYESYIYAEFEKFEEQDETLLRTDTR